MPWIKKKIRILLDILSLVYGITVYYFTKKTSSEACMSLMRLFCVSKGLSNDFLSTIIALYKGKYSFEKTSGILGELNEKSIDEISSNIKQEGYHIFEKPLPENLIMQAFEYAKTEKCIPRATDTSPPDFKERKILYDERGDCKSVIYDFELSDLIEAPFIQELMADTSLLAVAQAYLGCKPRLDFVTLWWTDPSKQPDCNAAQAFHFDLGRIKWIKFFVYITDVTPSNGPHCFIRETHRSGNIPADLLKHGYARITDEEISNHYSKDKIVTFNAKAGTILAEDTRGLHRGLPVLEGNRLMLQFQFSNSLFGSSKGYATEKTIIKEIKSKNLKDRLTTYPKAYSLYFKD